MTDYTIYEDTMEDDNDYDLSPEEAKLKLKYGDEKVYVIPGGVIDDVFQDVKFVKYFDVDYDELMRNLIETVVDDGEKVSITLPEGLDMGTLQKVFSITTAMLNGDFALRYKVELRPAFKQIIAYALIVAPDGRIYTTERLQGDPRLVGKISIGQGGHINSEDVDEDDYPSIGEALARELEEELGLDRFRYEETHVGFLHDNSNDVGQVHLGVVYIIKVNEEDAANIKSNEPNKLRGFWCDTPTLQAYRDASMMETWSEIVFDNFLSGQDQ